MKDKDFQKNIHPWFRNYLDPSGNSGNQKYSQLSNILKPILFWDTLYIYCNVVQYIQTHSFTTQTVPASLPAVGQYHPRMTHFWLFLPVMKVLKGEQVFFLSFVCSIWIISSKILSKIISKDSFKNLRISVFQNCPYFWFLTMLYQT